MSRSAVRTLKGDLEGALDDAARAVKLCPRDPKSFLARGDVLHRKGDLSRAIADFSQAIRLDPKSGTAYQKRGYGYYDERDWVKALQDLEEACELGQESVSLRLRIYLIRLRQGRHEEAARNLQDLANAEFLYKTTEDEKQVIRYLRGEISENELCRIVEGMDERLRLDAQCRVHFYSGTKTLVEGSKAGAAKLFEKAVRFRETLVDEYPSALTDLRDLREK